MSIIQPISLYSKIRKNILIFEPSRREQAKRSEARLKHSTHIENKNSDFYFQITKNATARCEKINMFFLNLTLLKKVFKILSTKNMLSNCKHLRSRPNPLTSSSTWIKIINTTIRWIPTIYSILSSLFSSRIWRQINLPI